MDKVQAEQYIHNSMITMATRKLFLSMFLICAIIAAICFSIYHEIIYTVFTAISLCSAVVICIVATRKRFRKEYYKAALMTCVTLIFCILLNLAMYGTFQYISTFVWWAYMILIISEILALFAWSLVNKFIVKKYANKRSRAVNASLAGSFGIGGSGLASTLTYIFHPSHDTLGFVLVSCICIMVCLFEGVIACQIFRAYLIKKYDVKCDY